MDFEDYKVLTALSNSNHLKILIQVLILFLFIIKNNKQTNILIMYGINYILKVN